MSAIQAISAMRYTAMANNSMLNMMNAANARMNLISSPMSNISFGSLDTLAYMDTQYELEMITNSLQYKMAKAMLEQIRKQQKEDAEKFSLFA